MENINSNQSNNDSALKPTPVVIAGPSGVGKGTLIQKLLADFPEKFGFSVSHTSRKPRNGESHGIQYYFSTVEDMSKEIAEGKFVEHANVHGNFYGTSKAAVETVMNQNKICILDIDVQGCEQVKKSSIKARYLFIVPPSPEELERRLRGRGSEAEESIQRRLTNARKELEYSSKTGFFDLILVNDDLDKTYNQLKQWVFLEV